MPTMHEIWWQIERLPHRYIFYTRKEIRYLPQVLGEGERIMALTSGYMENHTWLCVCTNRRVLFLDRGMFYGLRQVQMNLDRIQSIDSSQGIFFGTIRLWDGASSIAIGLVLKSTIAPFVRTVQEAMDHYKRSMMQSVVSAAQQPAQHTGSDWLTELERLAALRENGTISLQEFAEGKARLLGKK